VNERTLRKARLVGVSYCRVSTEGQFKNPDGTLRDDASPEAQRQRCIEYARHLKSKHGAQYDFCEHISDKGFSGKDTNRPGYQRLWDLVSSRKIDFIIATELSRISRSVADYLDLVSHCEKHRVAIYIIGLELDPTTSFGKAMVTILVTLSQFEREVTATRVRENARIRLLKDGKINGSSEILGLARDSNRKGHFKVFPPEVAELEELLRLYLRHSSRAKLLQAAKDAGLRGPGGKELTPRIIDSILDNVKWRYRGLWHVNLENKDKDVNSLPEALRFQTVKLDHGPLIDEKLLNEVQRKIDDTRSQRKKSGSGNYIYLLSHILYSEDGTRFSGQGAKGGLYRYYWNEKSGDRIHCEEIDDKVITHIRGYIQRADGFSELVRKAIQLREQKLPEVDSKLREVRTQIEETAGAESDLKKQLLNSEIRSRPNLLPWLEEEVMKLRQQHQQLLARADDLDRQRRDILARSGLEDVEATAREFAKRIQKLTRTEQRTLIERIVQRIVVRKDNNLEFQLKWAPPSVEEDPFLDWSKNGRDGGI
jgi:site-specific DNA recombinase